MQIQTQTRKIVKLTSKEIEAILVDYLQSKGIMEDGDDVTIEHVPEVVSIQLLGKFKSLKLENSKTCTENMEPEDDTTSVAEYIYSVLKYPI